MQTLNPAEMTKQWHANNRWSGIHRPYTSQQVEKLRGSFHVEHTLARLGAERLWWLLHHEEYVPALGALTGALGIRDSGGAVLAGLVHYNAQADVDRLLAGVAERSCRIPY